MKPRFFTVLDYCIETGVAMGIARAHKYNDKPTEDDLKEHIGREISNMLNEWFDMEGDDV